jgi:hypothetical protein
MYVFSGVSRWPFWHSVDSSRWPRSEKASTFTVG